MRIVDADVLSYALYDESPAHSYAWALVRRGVLGELELYVAPTTILETFNVLYWFYRVRPRRALLKKLQLVVDSLEVVEVSLNGIRIALESNVPLGDGFLIDAALKNRIPIVVSNDLHIAKAAPKYGLILENPIPEGVRAELSKWRARSSE